MLDFPFYAIKLEVPPVLSNKAIKHNICVSFLDEHIIEFLADRSGVKTGERSSLEQNFRHRRNDISYG